MPEKFQLPGGSPQTAPGFFDSAIVKLLMVAGLLYVFVVSINLIGVGFKLFGAGFADGLFTATTNPLSALCIGVLATVLVQSSSTTTSVIVGLVGAGTLSFGAAVPMVMGANIGTSVTNTLVSLAHISRDDEFKRAFAGSTVHDFFNICAVIVLLPLQIYFDVIGRSAHVLEELFEGFGGLTFASPFKAMTKPVAEHISHLAGDSAWIVVVVAMLLMLLSLRYIILIMKTLVLAKVERFFQRYVFRTPLLGMVLGIGLTVLVQSSSITTSIVVPLLGAGVLSLVQVYPYMLGANVGTTITAFLASFATGNPQAVAVAFAHLLFNAFGIAIFWPLQRIPIFLANKLSELSTKSKLVPLAYIVVVFVALPGLIIFLLE